MTKTTPTPDGRRRRPLRLLAGIAPKAGCEDDVLLQSMDESGRGPRKAVAEAVASPLGVQHSINSAGISSSNRLAARDDAAVKNYALRPVLCPCPAVA
jgi:hypothetical protein